MCHKILTVEPGDYALDYLDCFFKSPGGPGLRQDTGCLGHTGPRGRAGCLPCAAAAHLQTHPALLLPRGLAAVVLVFWRRLWFHWIGLGSALLWDLGMLLFSWFLYLCLTYLFCVSFHRL